MKTSYFLSTILLTLVTISCGGGGGGGGTAEVNIQNDPPDQQNKITLTSDAGANQTGPIKVQITLDGSNSTTTGDTVITYDWSFNQKPAGSTSILSNADTANPTFIADKAGQYFIKLIIHSGELSSAPSIVIVNALEPIANAGGNRKVSTESEVILDGSKSVYGGSDSLIYNWVIENKPATSNATFVDSSVVKPSFNADVDGEYTISLVVSIIYNGETISSQPNTSTILATTTPIAHAGQDQTVTVGIEVQLDGTESSSSNNEMFTYHWTLKKKPLNSLATLSDINAAMPTLTTDKKGQYIVQLFVKNETEKSSTDEVIITANPPTANAGVDQKVATGSVVTLNASDSSDPSNLLLSFLWEVLEAPDDNINILSDATLMEPQFTANAAGTYKIKLTVNNGTISSEQDMVIITAISPTANAGPDQKIITGTTVSLDANASQDGTGFALSYTWSLITKPENSITALDNESAIKPSFIADADGVYEVQLIVNNGLTDSAADFVKITATTLPIAVAGQDQVVSVNQSITLDGSTSSDAKGTDLLYHWDTKSKPADATPSFTDILTKNPIFMADKAGDYEISLIVNNTVDNSAEDSLTITAKTPIANPGPGYNVTPNTNIMLNGSDSLNVDDSKTGLTYLWSMESFPPSTSATLFDSSLSSPEFVPDVLGSYELCLTVNNTFIDSESACLMINARTSVGNASGIYSIDFEDSTTHNQWAASNGQWEIGKPNSGPNIAYVGTNVAATVLDDNYTDKTSSRLEGPSISLPEIVTGEELRLQFWHWFSFYPGRRSTPFSCNNASPQDVGYIQIAEESDFNTWTSIKSFTDTSPDWTLASVDLSLYQNKKIRLGFLLHNQSTNSCINGSRAGWYIDELIIDKTSSP